MSDALGHGSYGSFGYAPARQPSASMLDIFRSSKLCHKAAAGIQAVSRLSSDVEAGWEAASQRSRLIVGGATAAATALTSVTALAVASGLDGNMGGAAAVTAVLALYSASEAWNTWTDMAYDGAKDRAVQPV